MRQVAEDPRMFVPALGEMGKKALRTSPRAA